MSAIKVEQPPTVERPLISSQSRGTGAKATEQRTTNSRRLSREQDEEDASKRLLQQLGLLPGTPRPQPSGPALTVEDWARERPPANLDRPLPRPSLPGANSADARSAGRGILSRGVPPSAAPGAAPNPEDEAQSDQDQERVLSLLSLLIPIMRPILGVRALVSGKVSAEYLVPGIGTLASIFDSGTAFGFNGAKAVDMASKGRWTDALRAGADAVLAGDAALSTSGQTVAGAMALRRGVGTQAPGNVPIEQTPGSSTKDGAYRVRSGVKSGTSGGGGGSIPLDEPTLPPEERPTLPPSAPAPGRVRSPAEAKFQVNNPRIELMADEIRATWDGDNRAVVALKEANGVVEIRYFNAGAQTGQGAKMLASALRTAAKWLRRPSLARPRELASSQVINETIKSLMDAGRLDEAVKIVRRSALVYAQALGGTPGTPVLTKIGNKIAVRVPIIYE